jgi:hypothetical protein
MLTTDIRRSRWELEPRRHRIRCAVSELQCLLRWPGSDYLKKPGDEAESRSRQKLRRDASLETDLSKVTPTKLPLRQGPAADRDLESLSRFGSSAPAGRHGLSLTPPPVAPQ